MGECEAGRTTDGTDDLGFIHWIRSSKAAQVAVVLERAQTLTTAVGSPEAIKELQQQVELRVASFYEKLQSEWERLPASQRTYLRIQGQVLNIKSGGLYGNINLPAA